MSETFTVAYQRVQKAIDCGYTAASRLLLLRLCALKAEPSWQCLLARQENLLGNFEAAIALFQEAGKSLGHAWTVQLGLAEACESLGRFDDAEKWFIAATESWLYNTGPWICLGGFYLRHARLDDAFQALSRALEAREGFRQEVYYNLALYYRRLGRYLDAKIACEQAIDIEPGYSEAHRVLEDVEYCLTL